MSWETSGRHPAEQQQHTRAGKRTTSSRAEIAFASTGFQTPPGRVGRLAPPGTWPTSRSPPFRRPTPAEQDAASPSRCCGGCDEIQVCA